MQRLTGEVGDEEVGLSEVRKKGLSGAVALNTPSMAWRGGLEPDAPLSQLSGAWVEGALPFLGFNVVLLF